MSRDLVGLVWRASRAERGSRLVLLALAEDADEDGRARLSARELADRTRLSARHVRNCIVELKALGELHVTRGGRGPGDASEYRLLPNLLQGGSAEHKVEAHDPETPSPRRKSTTEGGKGEHPSEGEVPSRARTVGTPFGSTPSSSKPACPPEGVDGGGSVPDGARQLVDALTAAGMLVGWGLDAAEWARVVELVGRWGPSALVEFTSRRWDPTRPPKTARYLLRMWSDLPSHAAAPADAAPTARPPVNGWQAYRNTTPADVYENGF